MPFPLRFDIVVAGKAELLNVRPLAKSPVISKRSITLAKSGTIVGQSVAEASGRYDLDARFYFTRIYYWKVLRGKREDETKIGGNRQSLIFLTALEGSVQQTTYDGRQSFV